MSDRIETVVIFVILGLLFFACAQTCARGIDAEQTPDHIMEQRAAVLAGQQ